MVKKKSSKKKVSYNNKTIVIGVIVLVILFVFAFAYQGSREDEEGLGTEGFLAPFEDLFYSFVFEDKTLKPNDDNGDDEEKKSYVCCYIQCHNKKMPPYDFKVFNLEKEECNNIS